MIEFIVGVIFGMVLTLLVAKYITERNNDDEIR